MRSRGLIPSLVMLLALVHLTTQANLFNIFPNVNMYLGNSNLPTFVRIAADESMVIVGFTNGTVKSYTMSGNYINTYNGHTNTIVGIEWVNPGIPGFVTLDSGGKAIFWNTNATAIQTTFMNTTNVYNMDSTSYNNMTYIAVSVGSSVIEFVLNSSSFTKLNTVYQATSGTYINNVIYGPGWSILMAGTNTSQVQAFNTSTKTFTNMTFSMAYNVNAFSLYSNNQFVLLNNGNQLYTFSFNNGTNLSYTKIGTTTYYAFTMTACPSSSYIVTAENSYAYIDVYDSFATQTQRLSYPYSTVYALDCSTNYLASVDRSYYLALDKYDTVGIKLPGWAIGVIAGVCGVVVIVIIVVVIVVVIRRKRAQAQLNSTGYGNQMLPPQTPSNSYPNQPYLNNNYQQRY